MVPGEVCAERAERRNHSRKAVLNAQKSAEAIVPWEKTQGKGGTNTSRSNRGKEDGMKNAENVRSCLQRDSTECKGYAGAQSAVQPGSGETAGRSQNLLEAILYRDNLNRAYKRVKANKGAPGVDGMTVEEALPWLKEHGKEMTEAIRSGKYKPTPVRRKEIPKPDGGVRKLGIPTVKDRIVQQAIAQQLMPLYAGDVKQNVRRAQAYCWFAVQKNCAPIATHLLFPQFMDDTDPAQQQQALFMSRLLLTKCNEVWVFGETISQGMASEIRKAESRNKTIRYFTKDCQEVQASCEN